MGSSVASIRDSMMKLIGKKNLKIIAATSVAIFSLLAVIGGAYSWFTLSMNQVSETTDFAVVNLGSCDLYSIDLIKFDYDTTVYDDGENVFTVIDYLSPENGTVNKYGYNKEESSFGYDDGTWHSVDMMNTYDPVTLLIYGGGVKSLNCNSIYKFVVSSPELDNVVLNASVSKLVDAVKGANDIFLTECADFDIYFESDLADDNPKFIDGSDTKMYYPNYIDKSETLTAEEAIYYKISYLSDLETSHVNFFTGSDTEKTLAGDKHTSFVYDSTSGLNLLTIYVNVNYNPEQLEYTSTAIYQRNIKAVCDFAFKFFFFKDEGNEQL